MSPDSSEHVASFEVSVDGEALAREHLDRIKEIRVADQLRLPDLCTVVIAYPRGEGIDRMPFDLGKALEVRLGARQSLVPRPLFVGKVTTIEPEFGAGGCSVTVRAFDGSHVLHRARRVRTFQNQTASDIVEKIVRDAGIANIETQASGEPYTYVQQDNETDWDFIWRLADRVGFEFTLQDDRATFGPPEPESKVELEWPGALRTFRPRVTAVQQVQRVSVGAFHPETKDAIASEASTPSRPTDIGIRRDDIENAFGAAEFHVATEPVETAAHGDQLAQALLDRLSEAFLTADGVSVGDPRIRSGANLTVKGIGTRFGGSYRVAGATHVLRGGGAYETHFTNTANRTIIGATGGSGSGAPRFGADLVIGLVTNNDDPKDMARVRVTYPALGPDESAWAHVVTPFAGKERGLLMLPVPGQQVLIGFEHGDTSRPMVLGSVFNGADNAGALTADHDGSFVLHTDGQLLVTAEKDALVDLKDLFTLKVAKDTEITIDGGATAKVQNALEAGAREITLKADMALTLEANTTLSLKCGPASIELGPSGVKISGPMITLG